MKARLGIWMGALLVGGLLTASAGAQSLGDYARQQRAQKPATPANKVYTNDNLPTSGGLSEVGRPAAAAPSGSASASKGEEKPEDRSAQETEWRARIKEAKDHIATLEREIAVRKGENQTQNVRYLMFYPKMAEEADKNQKEIEQKQKELVEAKQRLEDLRDELRKKDLPRSWGD